MVEQRGPPCVRESPESGCGSSSCALRLVQHPRCSPAWLLFAELSPLFFSAGLCGGTCVNGHMSLVFFGRENDITPVLDHTFCVEHNAFGRILQHELKPNGRNVPVTEENKKEYVR